MRIDLHNHTTRCNHAEGTVGEYIVRAIELGIDIKNTQSDINNATTMLKEYNIKDITYKDKISYITSTMELLTGILVVPYANGGKIEAYIPMKNGKRNGHAVWRDSYGDKEKECDYVNNEKHGVGTEYYPGEGLKSKTTYEYGLKNGEKDGSEKEYNKNGIIIVEKIYNNGELIRDFVAEREKIAAAKRAKEEAKRAESSSSSYAYSSSSTFIQHRKK